MENTLKLKRPWPHDTEFYTPDGHNVWAVATAHTLGWHGWLPAGWRVIRDLLLAGF